MPSAENIFPSKYEGSNRAKDISSERKDSKDEEINKIS